MSLGARLLLLGAIVPALALLGALAIGRAMFAREIFGAVDDGMRTQAAVEAASLFDREGGEPHLHLRSSPLASLADPSAGAVYDARGEPVARWPEGVTIPERVDPAAASARPALRTSSSADGRVRELVVRVRSPDGRIWALWLGHDLTPHEAALAAFDRTAALLVVLVTLMLLALQITHAARLTSRVRALAAHMKRVREGDLASVPRPDPARDLIGELRDSIADATARLLAAREARERLIADAAHELRTPLATMRTAIDVTLRRERDTSELRDALERTRDEVDRLAATAADLLELASGGRAEEPHERLDLAELVVSSVDAMRDQAAERAIELRIDGAPRVPLDGAPRALRRAIDNLIANAVTFSPDGAAIDVTLELDDERARLRVQDRGPGIPEAERDAIFEPFHRLDRARTGTGLGLAIVRDVAARHGGRAFASAPEGGGAQLVLEIARAAAPHA